MMFNLHQQLEKDSIFAASAGGCQLRLMQDARYFWLLLIPEVEGATELHDLDAFSHDRVCRLIRHCSIGLKRAAGASKMNIAAIGNMVPQLHIHLVARNPGDAAWPQPVWGIGTAEIMSPSEQEWRLAVARDLAATFEDALV